MVVVVVLLVVVECLGQVVIMGSRGANVQTDSGTGARTLGKTWSPGS